MPHSKPEPVTRNCDFLIHNAHVITMNATREIFPAGAVAIDGNTIVDVGRDSELLSRWRPSQKIDAGGKPVHPGLIDSHYHPMGIGARMILSDEPLTGADPSSSTRTRYLNWLNAMHDEDETAAMALSCAEMLRHGYTCFLEPGTLLNTQMCAEVMQSIGVRGSLAGGWLWDREGIHLSGFARAPASVRRARDELESELWRNRDPDALVRGHIAIWGLGACSDHLVAEASDTASRANVVFTMHQSMSTDDAAHDAERFGVNPLVHWNRLGVLGPHCLFSHMNVLAEDEIAAVVGSGMSVAWIPGNVMYWGTGGKKQGPMPELHRRGGGITLGMDMAKAWAFGDVSLIAYLLARMQGEYLPVETLLEMLTIGAARALIMDQWIGSLEIGKRADLVIRRNDLPETCPGDHPIAQIILTARSLSVETVFVDGRMVHSSGALVNVDETEIRARARDSAAAWAARAGIAPWRPCWPQTT